MVPFILFGFPNSSAKKISAYFGTWNVQHLAYTIHFSLRKEASIVNLGTDCVLTFVYFFRKAFLSVATLFDSAKQLGIIVHISFSFLQSGLVFQTS
jgi:hypothetical protein